jgi:hypothetical protein
MPAEAWDALEGLDDVLGGDQARALEVPGRALVAGTPEEVVVVEAQPGVVPAGVAGVSMLHGAK